MEYDICLGRNVAHPPNGIDHIRKKTIKEKIRTNDPIEKELMANSKQNVQNDPKRHKDAKQIFF